MKRRAVKAMLLMLMTSIMSILTVSSRAEAGEYKYEEVFNENAFTGVQSSKWMSVLPDDRYLYEINIPGTHDSAMRVKGYLRPDSTARMGTGYAETQYSDMTISKQLSSGIRLFDFRITNECPHNIPADSLMLVHGQKESGLGDCRFWATRDRRFLYNKFFWSSMSYRIGLVDDAKLRESLIYFEVAMNDVVEFLKQNPSETVIIDMSYESGSGDENKTYELMKKKLKNYESYIYKPANGSWRYNTIPTLGEARGKIVIISSGAKKFGYGLEYHTSDGWGKTSVGDMPFSYENHYVADTTHKKQYVKKFFEGGEVAKWSQYDKTSILANKQIIPESLSEHLPHGNVVCTTANRITRAGHLINFLGNKPTTIAAAVNPMLFDGDNRLFKDGYHYGWIFSDFVTPGGTKLIYQTNFPTGMSAFRRELVYDYNTDIMKFASKKFDDFYTTDVWTGSTIQLRPVDYEPAEGEDKDFIGWKVEIGGVTQDKLYQPGDKIVISENTRITAQWGNTWNSVARAAYALDNTGEEAHYVLKNDISAGMRDSSIIVNKGKLSLSLNGHSIDGRALCNKCAFYVDGELELKGPGTIYGGTYSWINDKRKKNFRAGVGGAVTLADRETNNGTEGGRLTLDNVTITGSSAGYTGAGVYVSPHSSLKLKGKVIVNDNLIGGRPGRPGNICIYNNKIDAGELAEGSEIGVCPVNSNGINMRAFTVGLKGNTGYFVSDDSNMEVIAIDGEAALRRKGCHTVSFNTCGGRCIASQIIEDKKTAAKPDDPVKADEKRVGMSDQFYRFAGWYKDAAYTQLFSFDEGISSDMTLFAKWESCITLDKKDGSDAAQSWISEGSKFVKPVDPVRDGYDFEGWFYKPEKNSEEIKYDFDMAVTGSALTLTARWKEKSKEENKYIVTFDDCFGHVSSNEVLSGNKVSEPSAPQNDNYEFKFWYQADGEEKEYDFDSPVSSNMILLASWEKKAEEYQPLYTVGFYEEISETATPVKKLEVREGGSLSENDIPQAEDREGYVFDDWYILDDGEITAPFTTSMQIYDDLMLIAMYDMEAEEEQETNDESLTVIFDPGNGEASNSVSAKKGDTISEPAAPTCKDCDFEGWFEELESVSMNDLADMMSLSANTANEDIAKELSDYPVLGEIIRLDADYNIYMRYDFGEPLMDDIYLLAFYTPITVEENTVSFMGLSGNVIMTDEIVSGNSVSRPEDPSEDGYDFEGWYRDSTFSHLYDFSLPVEKDTLIYGKFSRISHTVYYKSSDGKSLDEQDVLWGEKGRQPASIQNGDWYECIADGVSFSKYREIMEALKEEEASMEDEYETAKEDGTVSENDLAQIKKELDEYIEYINSLKFYDSCIYQKYDFDEPVRQDKVLMVFDSGEDNSCEIDRYYLYSDEIKEKINLTEYLPWWDSGSVGFAVKGSSGDLALKGDPIISGSEENYLEYELKPVNSANAGSRRGVITVSTNSEVYGEYTISVNVIRQSLALYEKTGKKTYEARSRKKLLSGKKCTLVARIADDIEADNRMTWTSSNPMVASVTQKGIITAHAAGKAVISATGKDDRLGGIKAVCEVEVSEPVNSIILDSTKYSMGVSENYIIEPLVLPYSKGRALSWSVSNRDIIEVTPYQDLKSARVTAKKAGNASVIIKALDGSGVKAVCRISVGNPVRGLTISGNKGRDCLAAGSRLAMKVSWSDKKPKNTKVTWSVDDSSIATISDKGVLTGISEGTVNVTAVSLANGAMTASTAIRVYMPVKKAVLSAKSAVLSLSDNATPLFLEADLTSIKEGIAPTGESMGEEPKVRFFVDDKYREYVSISQNDGDMYATLTGLKEGRAIPVKAGISAFNGYNKILKCKVSVKKSSPLKGIKLSAKKLSLGVGEVQSLKVTTNPLNPDKDPGAKWTSSDENTVTVDQNGRVVGVKTGTAVISVDISGKVKSCRVNVIPSIKEVSVNNAEKLVSSGLAVGKSYKLKTYLSYLGEGRTKKSGLVYTSSDESVATVTKKGSIKAKAPGSVVITVCSASEMSDGSMPHDSVKFEVYRKATKLILNKKKLTVGSVSDNRYGMVAVAKIYPSGLESPVIRWSTNNDKVRIAAVTGLESEDRVEYVSATSGSYVYTDGDHYIAICGNSPGVTKLTGVAMDGSNKKVTCRLTVTGPDT